MHEESIRFRKEAAAFQSRYISLESLRKPTKNLRLAGVPGETTTG
jgi:hypothetical protein